LRQKKWSTQNLELVHNVTPKYLTLKDSKERIIIKMIDAGASPTTSEHGTKHRRILAHDKLFESFEVGCAKLKRNS
jgi:hypothetical protein